MRRRRPGLRTEEISPAGTFPLNKKADSKAGPACRRGEDSLCRSPKSANPPRQKDSSPRCVRKRSGSLSPTVWRRSSAPGSPPKTRRVPPELSLPCRVRRRAFRRCFLRCPAPRRCDALPACAVLPSRFFPAPFFRPASAPLSFCASAHRSPARRAPRPRRWTPLQECR